MCYVWSQILSAERAAAAADADQSATVDAHVVAPCPHDGGCPMDGTRTWCHFVQRFERGRLQQQVKALPGEPAPSSYAVLAHSVAILPGLPQPWCSAVSCWVC